MNIFAQNVNILIQNGATDRRLALITNVTKTIAKFSEDYWRSFLLVFICSSSSRLRSNRSIFSTIFPTATPVPKTARTNPANVMYSIIIITPPPFQSEGSYDIPPFQKGQPPTVMVAPCLLRLFYCIILFSSRQEQMFSPSTPPSHFLPDSAAYPLHPLHKRSLHQSYPNHVNQRAHNKYTNRTTKHMQYKIVAIIHICIM